MDGESLFNLIVRSQEWVHRRVDKIHLTSAGRTRRLVSVDFTAPKKYTIKASGGKCIVPLAMLRKQPQRAFDVKSASGQSLPVLNTTQHAQLVVKMLLAALTVCGVKPLSGKHHDYELAKELVVAHERESALEAESNFLRTLDFTSAEAPLKIFAEKIIQTLRDSYVLLVELDRLILGCRSVVKYSYDEEEIPKKSLHRKSGVRHREYNEVAFETSIPDPGFAKSQHVEIWVPDDVELGSSSVAWWFGLGTPVDSEVERERYGQRIAHVSTSNIDRFCEAKAFFIVRPIKTGLNAFALIALIAFVSIAIVATIVMEMPSGSLLGHWIIPSQAASIILVAPAILLSWLARPPENSVVYQALLPLRTLVCFIAFGFLLMALAAAVPLNPVVWKLLWWIIWILVVVCVLLWVVFCRYRRRKNNRHWRRAGIG